MFTEFPTYSRFRTLQLVSPLQRGEDVYALQTALNELGFDCGEADGMFGPATSRAVTAAQRKNSLVVDGLAGGSTQQTLAMGIASNVAQALDVPISAFRGQLELESGFRLGNYSPIRIDGTYDAGVAQRNTKFTSPQSGFDTKASIVALGTTIRTHFLLFEGIGSRAWRWSLAQGAWNAPAFACYLAREQGAFKVTASMTLKPSDEQRKIFMAYVANASTYLKV